MLTIWIHSCFIIATSDLWYNLLFHYLFSSNGTTYIDNLDQRITADTNVFCTIYGSIITNLIVAPACIIYYTYDAYSRTGWIGPTAMFILFLVRYHLILEFKCFYFQYYKKSNIHFESEDFLLFFQRLHQ